MRRIFFLAAISLVAIQLKAVDDPSLVIQTKTDSVVVPVATIRSIQYQKTDGSEMYLHTKEGKLTFVVSDIVKMTFRNMPALLSKDNSCVSSQQVNGQKYLMNGRVIIKKEKEIYSILGGREQ